MISIELQDTPLTMSSVEIAELMGKDHRHVLRDIRKMLDEMGEGGLPKFGQTYQDGQGKEQPMFRLPRRETMILISGYSIPVRTKIVDRWEALEAQTRGWEPPDTAEAIAKARKSELLRMALKHAERAEALADENL